VGLTVDGKSPGVTRRAVGDTSRTRMTVQQSSTTSSPDTVVPLLDTIQKIDVAFGLARTSHRTNALTSSSVASFRPRHDRVASFRPHEIFGESTTTIGARNISIIITVINLFVKKAQYMTETRLTASFPGQPG